MIIDKIEKEAVFAYLRPRAGMNVLDIGCGTGNYSLVLAQKGLKVTGIDISPQMLAQARAKAEKENLAIKFIIADAMALPFPNNFFDRVLAVSSVEFLPDLGAALNEAYRVLKQGGRLVVGTIGRNSAWGRYYTEKARRDSKSVYRQARFYTLQELKNAMPGKDARARTVLFVPPDFNYKSEQEIWETEAAAAKSGRTDGGFIVAVSIK